MSESTMTPADIAKALAESLAEAVKMDSGVTRARQRAGKFWFRNVLCDMIVLIWNNRLYRAPNQRSNSDDKAAFFAGIPTVGENETPLIREAKAEKLWNLAQKALSEPAFTRRLKGVVTNDSLKGLRDAIKDGGPEAVHAFMAEKGIDTLAGLDKIGKVSNPDTKAAMIARFLQGETPEVRESLLENVAKILAKYDADQAAEAEKAAAEKAEAAAKKALSATLPKDGNEPVGPLASALLMKAKPNGVDATGRSA